MITKKAICIAALMPLFSLAAQEVQREMRSIYIPFKNLERFVGDQDAFEDPKNGAEITALLEALRNNFHSLETTPTRFKSQPGFQDNLAMVRDLLDDSARRFKEGKKPYAWWRLRSLATNCFTCHATYNVEVKFNGPSFDLTGLPPLIAAELLLASRQFDAAEAALKAVVRSNSGSTEELDALRELLVLYTRIQRDPAASAKELAKLLAESDLPAGDREEVQGWITSLERWSKSDSHKGPQTVAAAEGMMRTALSSASRDLTAPDPVTMLRASAILHKQFESGKLPESDRRKALLLLGIAYSKLPLFFADGLPELYFEMCINGHAGSEEAKRAYRALKEYVEDDFTGSAGTSVPADLKAHLEELRKKAYREPSLDGRL